MTDVNSITYALCVVQKKLQVPKNRINSFAKYKYRNCEDILEAIKEVLHPNSAVTLTDDIKLIGDRYYVEAIATFWWGEKFVSVKAYAREPLEKKGSDASQITGATSSYARKYALNGLFAIDDSDDSDSGNQYDNNPQYAQKKSEPVRNDPLGTFSEGAQEVLTIDQVSKIGELIGQAGSDSAKLLAYYNISSWYECPSSKYEAITRGLLKKIREKPSVLDGVAKYARV